jgi:peptidoglycan/xylan/chitin deacetylase (PgdA/CDA1 family)
MMMEENIRKIKFYFLLYFTVIIFILFFGSMFWDRGFYSFFGYLRSSVIRAEYENYAANNRIFNPVYFFRASAKDEWNFDNGQADSVPVLTYHGITGEDDNSTTNISAARFKEQMFALKKAGYTAIDTEELYKFMRGEISLPHRSVLITFDDGRVDSFQNGDPVLRALDLEATIFVITQHSVDGQSTYYLSKDQLLQMEKSGRWDIEVHTHAGHDNFPIDDKGVVGHFFSHKLWLESLGRRELTQEFTDRISNDMSIAKNKLTELLGKEIFGFAVPFGDFGQWSEDDFPVEDVVLAQSFKYFPMLFYQNALASRFGTNYADPDKKNYLIKRIDVHSQMSGDELLKELEKSEAKKLPYTDDFNTDNGWISTGWGNFEINPLESKLALLPKAPNGAGSAVVLDGTGGWKDYSIKASLRSPYRSSAFIWVRFKDDKNNAACNIGRGFAHIEQVVDGDKRVIRGLRPAQLPEGKFEMEVRVKGRNVRCYVDGQLLVETNFLDESLKKGGIGFKVWDSEVGSQAILEASHLEVGEL